MIILYTDETQHCVMDESARPYEKRTVGLTTVCPVILLSLIHI